MCTLQLHAFALRAGNWPSAFTYRWNTSLARGSIMAHTDIAIIHPSNFLLIALNLAAKNLDLIESRKDNENDLS